MLISVTSIRYKVKIKVTRLLKFQKLHYSRSISSAILGWNSKLMIDYDSMGPNLQPVEARFSHFLLRKLSQEFKLHEISILHEFQVDIFPALIYSTHRLLVVGLWIIVVQSIFTFVVY